MELRSLMSIRIVRYDLTHTEQHDLILMYKFVFSLVDVQTSNFITPRNDAVPTRGNPYKVLLAVSSANVRRHFFTE